MKGLYAHLSSWHIDPCRFPEVRVNNTPMMIRANSILGMVSIISFMSQI